MRANQNVLVIGGTRFIGHHCVHALLEKGHRVTILHRGHHSTEFPEVEVVQGNREVAEDLKKVLEGRSFDAVIDCIAYTERDARQAVELFSGKIGHYIFLSSASIYLLGQSHFPPFREEDIFLDPSESVERSGRHAYGANKRKADLYFLRSHDESNFPVTCLRLPVVTGPRDYTGRLASYYHRILDGQPLILPENGLNTFGFVYVEDVARFISNHLGNRKLLGRAVNLSQREVVTLKETIKAMAHSLAHPVHLVSQPAALLMRHSVGTSFSPLSYPMHVVLDTSFAVREFGFSPTPFRVWLTKAVQHFKSAPSRDLFASTRRHEINLAREYSAMTEQAPGRVE